MIGLAIIGLGNALAPHAKAILDLTDRVIQLANGGAAAPGGPGAASAPKTPASGGPAKP